MKSSKIVLAMAVAVLAATVSGSAFAWNHGGHARFGVYIGGPGFWYHQPYYYPPYYSPYYPGYAYPPVVVAPPAPQVYIEQGSLAPAQAPAQSQSPSPSNWWYYCADTKGYYPYVKECPAGWQRVAPQPQQ